MNLGCFVGEYLVKWYEVGDVEVDVRDDWSWWVCKKLGLWIWIVIIFFFWYVREREREWMVGLNCCFEVEIGFMWLIGFF